MTLPELNLGFIFPELLLTGVLALACLAEAFSGKAAPASGGVSRTSLSTLAGTLLGFAAVLPFAGKIGSAFGGMFLLDPFATFFKVFFALTAFVIIQMARRYFAGTGKGHAEYFLIVLTTLIGLFFLVSANDFLMLFVSLEIVTLSFYILAAYARHELISIEAGIKYLIIGSLASAFLIFGVSLIYFQAGTTAFPEVRQFALLYPDNKLLLLGILMILAGAGFKMAAFPFQFWVPDVYEGAPTPTVAYLSVASKAAGFAIFLRLIFIVFPVITESYAFLLALIAAATLLYGNLGALVQTNIKRLFGYSSIGHAGYLLIGSVGGQFGAEAMLYYLIAYAVSTLAVFYLLSLAGKQLQSDDIAAYQGLAQRSPFLAGALFLALLSSAGVPPLAGFTGKFFVLLSAIRADMEWLALLGAILVVVSLYYYLVIVRTMYFEEPVRKEPVTADLFSRLFIVAISAAIIVVGVWQAPFMAFAQNAARYLF